MTDPAISSTAIVEVSAVALAVVVTISTGPPSALSTMEFPTAPVRAALVIPTAIDPEPEDRRVLAETGDAVWAFVIVCPEFTTSKKPPVCVGVASGAAVSPQKACCITRFLIEPIGL